MAQILVKLLINKKQHNNPKDRSQWSLFFPSVLTLTRTWPIYNKGTPIFLIFLNRKQIQENKTRPTHFPLRSKYKPELQTHKHNLTNKDGERERERERERFQRPCSQNTSHTWGR
jgi:hypothetical protein